MFIKDDKIVIVSDRICIYHIASRIINIMENKSNNIKIIQNKINDFLNNNTNNTNSNYGTPPPTASPLSPSEYYTPPTSLVGGTSPEVSLDDLIEYIENNPDPIRKSILPLITNSIKELKDLKKTNAENALEILGDALDSKNKKKVDSNKVYKTIKKGLVDVLMMAWKNKYHSRDITLLTLCLLCIGPSTTTIIVFVYYFLTRYLDTCLEAMPAGRDFVWFGGILPIPWPELTKIKKASVCLVAFMFVYYTCIHMMEITPGELDTFIGNISWGALYIIRQFGVEKEIFGKEINPNTPVNELGEMLTGWMYQNIIITIKNIVYDFYMGMAQTGTRYISSGYWFGEKWEGSRQIQGPIITRQDYLDIKNTCFDVPLLDNIGQPLVDERYCFPGAEQLGDGTLVFKEYVFNINNILIIGQMKLFLEMLNEQSSSIQYIVNMLSEIKKLLYKLVTGGPEAVKKAATKVAEGFNWFGSKTTEYISYVKDKATQWSDNQDFFEEMRLQYIQQQQQLEAHGQVPGIEAVQEIIATGGGKRSKSKLVKRTHKISTSSANYNYKFIYDVVNKVANLFKNVIFLYISIKQIDNISQKDMLKLNKFFKPVFKLINNMINKNRSLKSINVKEMCDFIAISNYANEFKKELMRGDKKSFLMKINMNIIISIMRNIKINKGLTSGSKSKKIKYYGVRRRSSNKRVKATKKARNKKYLKKRSRKKTNKK